MSGRRIELSITQVTSSVLAAVTGAIVASSLGVAGTIIGVAVVSFATTAGTAIYRHYLGRTQERLRSAAAAMGHLATATDGQTRPGHVGANTSPMTGQAGNSHGRAAHQRGEHAAPGLPGEQTVSGRRYGAPTTAHHRASGEVSGAPAAGGPAYGGHSNGGQSTGGQSNAGQPGSPVHETWIIPVQVAARLRAEAEGAPVARHDGGQPAGASEPDDSEPGTTALSTGAAAAGTRRTGPAHAGPAAGGTSDGSTRMAATSGGATSGGGTPAGGTPGSGGPSGDGPHRGGTDEEKPIRQKLADVIDWARTERWPKFAAIAVMIFVLAMGGITILEAATGKPLDALIWGAHNSGTTVGNVVSGPAHRSHHPGPATPTPHRTPTHHTPSPTPSATTPTPTPKATQPTPTPTPTTRTPSPSPTPSAGTHSPSSSGGSTAP